MSRKSKKQRYSSSSPRATKSVSLAQARVLTNKHPENAHYWYALGIAFIEAHAWQEAKEALQQADQLAPGNAKTLEALARATNNCGDSETAVKLFDASLALDNDSPQTHFAYSRVLFDRSQYPKALTHIEQALALMPENLDMLSHYSLILYRLHRYRDSDGVLNKLLKRQPEHYSHWNNVANLRRDLGLLDEADHYYQEAIKRTKGNANPYSNRLTALHYNPHVSREAIFDVCREWEKYYAPRLGLLQPLAVPEPDKLLRVGMISDGFRQHPVGKMINKVLEAIPQHTIELFAYSANSAIDPLTLRIRRSVSQWMSVTHLTDEQLGQQIIDDRIDILMDLSGHNTGSRMRTMAMKPAPIQVKWVGGLINTTGLSTMDYLLSDSIETPKGEDSFYVEKLIRLPDDYICYDPGDDRPSPEALPAKSNGYITLGCFNNPTKINETVLEQWALIMHKLPGSHLFLKGFQFNSLDLCQRVRSFMEAQGVATERLIIEGPSPHLELMEAYRCVDIALDPWPYSGGLTTCEALIMGVPVVTLPGPTFAGRHSATHLVNAGMPELVVNSWDEYRERVLELASDIESLATIRTHLRDVLLQSPVCDAPRFAKHFTIAMRAIWQRYCEGKAPEALTFNKEGEAQFADEDAPVEIHYSPKAKEEIQAGFNWQFNGKIIAIDNSSKLVNQGNIQMLRQLNAFGIVVFDPASRVQNPVEFEGSNDVQVLPHAVLCDGQQATLHACLDPAFSSTLKPLPPEQQHGANPQGAKVLAKLPINTIALDSIEGLESLDWLILDELSDATAILENGEKALKDTLAIQLRIAFQPTHHHQPNLAEIQHWMARHGFRFYRFNDQQHLSHLPENIPMEKRQATELQSADALFLPSHERQAQLTDNQRTKLAFLLHTVYGIKDMAYELLAEVDKEKAERYLSSDDAATLPYRQSTPAVKPKPANTNDNRKTETVSGDIDNLLDETEGLTSEPAIPKMFPAVPQTAAAKSHEPKNRNLWELDEPIHVVDIGANPIDGTPPYAGLLKNGLVKLVGFEPQKDALQKLQVMKGPNETYLPHAVGTGEKTRLFICQASGMTSTLKPNNEVLNHFQGYPIWGKVKAVEEINTVRLDDVEEIEKIDWLKIDIQGGELNVFKNAEDKLKNTLVIQTEVNFIQLYENQPLFAEIDQWMRVHGFMLHTLLEQRKRLYAPMKINGGIHQGINQLTTADAVYVRDINLPDLTTEQRKKIAFILSKAYSSHDLAYRLLMREKSFNKKDFFKKVVGQQINAISVD